MSDFAKDELGYLYNFVYRGAASIRMDKHYELKLKLKLMIDSYCGHDLSGGECEIFVDICSKCNAFMTRSSHYER